jgi:hypothetical protein
MSSDLWPSVPNEIRIEKDSKVMRCKRNNDFYALYGCPSKDNHNRVLTSLNDGMIVVLEGLPPKEDVPITCPIFAVQPSQILAVPTGKIFIRFDEDILALDYTAEVERLGYEIEESPIYAPHALWLRPKSGVVAEALAHAQDLRQLPHIANVEPQLLIERKLRV